MKITHYILAALLLLAGNVRAAVINVPADYLTIQDAVNNAAPNDTIIVAAGTYTENVTVNKPLILQGAQAGVDARGRVVGAPNPLVETVVTPAVAGSGTIILSTSTSATVVDGFAFTGGTSLGVIQTQSGSAYDNLQIINNHFSGYSQSAVFMNRGGVNITIAKNVMDGSNISGSGQAIFGNGPQTFAGLYITDNWVINNKGRYGFFVDGDHNVGESATRAPLIGGNTFSNNLQALNLGSRSFGKLGAPVLGAFAGVISNNIFANHTASGIQAGIQHVLVAKNRFINNTLSGLALTSFGNTGIDRGARTNLLTGNLFSGNGSEDLFLSSGQQVGSIASSKISSNSFGSTTAITFNQDGVAANLVDCSGNWWGNSTGPTLASHPSGTGKTIAGTGGGRVDFTPWLNTGTNFDFVDVGFLGSFHTLHVSTDSPQVGSVGRIQEGIDLTSGSTVLVGPGTYVENLDLNTSVSVIGTGGSGVTTIVLNPTGSIYSDTILIEASDVQVMGFTITGFNATVGVDSDLAGINFLLNPGVTNVEIANNVIQVGNISASSNGDDGKGVLTTYSLTPPYADDIRVHDNTFQALAPIGESVIGARAFYINPTVLNFTFSANIINSNLYHATSEAGLSIIECNTVNGTGTGDDSGGFAIYGSAWPANGHAIIRNNFINNTTDAIILFDTGDAVVTNNTLSGNGTAIRATDVAGVDVSGNRIRYNSIAGAVLYGVDNQAAVGVLDALSNWWGNATGPNAPSNPTGTGSPVTANVTFNPWLGDGTDTSGSCGFQPNLAPIFCFPPIITCPGNISVNTSPGVCTSNVTFIVTATNDCGGLTISNYPASGSPFPKGVTTVYSTVTDGLGQTATCSFSVTVTDNEPPTITCAPDKTVNADANQCYASKANVLALIGTPASSDNCPGSSVSSNAPATFPACQTTAITWTVTDAVGNTATCQQNVTVLEHVPPQISFVSDVTVECSSDMSTNSLGWPTNITDNCDPSPALAYVDHSAVEVTTNTPAQWSFYTQQTATAEFVEGPTDTPLPTGSAHLTTVDPDAVAEIGDTNYQNTLLSTLTELSYRSLRTVGSNSQNHSIYLILTVTNGVDATLDFLVFEPRYQNGSNPALPLQGVALNNAWHRWNALIGGWYSYNHPGIASPGAPAPLNAGVQPLSVYLSNYPNTKIVNDGGNGLSLDAGDAVGLWAGFDGKVDEMIIGTNGVSTAYNFELVPGLDCNITKDKDIVIRTFTATDACGNKRSSSQTILVKDTTGPLVTCPAASTVSCAGNVPANATDYGSFVAAGGSASDTCGAVTVGFVSDVISGQTCDNRYTITRTYRATDVCGNSASCAQLITVDDETAPSITCPVAVTVSCSGNVPATDFAGGTATDNCPGLVNVTWISDVISGQTCDNRYTITRTYRATDVCGNSASCAQLITVDDETPPSITCPVAATVSCAGNVPANDFAGGTATDNCPGLVNVTWISDVISGQTCDNRYTITRTYRATDVCGNSASCAQLITVDDETAPSITCPVAVTVSCSGNVPASDFAGGTATDNCPGLVNVTWIGDVISGQTCDNRYTITRTYRATDVCGNSASCAQLITVDDETAPSITCPVAVTVSCSGNVPATDFAGGTATDNCPGLVNVTWISDVISGQTCDNRYTITRTYRATDVCGNSASCAQLITVDDETAPVLTCVPDITVDCSVSLVPANTGGSATAIDNCDPSPTVSYTDYVPTEITPGNMGDWTFYTTDDSGVLGTGTGTGSMVNGPPVPPLGTGSANLKTASGAGDGSVQLRTTDWAGTRLADLTELQYSTFVAAWNGPGGQATYCTLWINTAGTGGTADDRIHFEPVFSAAGAGNGNPNPQPAPTVNLWQKWDLIKGMWYSDNGLPNSGVFPADPNGPGDHAITLAAYLALYPNAKIVNATPTVGGVRITSGFASPGDDFDVSVDAFTIGTNGVSTAYDFDLTPGNACANTVVVRQWQATDSCGNSSYCSQLIRVQDTTPPQITGVPADTTVQCNVVPAAAATLPASDNCDLSVTAATLNPDQTTPGACANAYTITRTWTSTDACGNSSTATQIISVIDTTAPSITCPVAVTVSCSGNVPANDFAGGTATDNCPGLVNVTWISDVISGQTCDNRYTITRTYRATDVCGNSASCAQLITVDDQTPPSITAFPADVTVSCSSAVPPANNASVTATDNCPGVVAVTHDPDGISGLTCPNRYTITRTYHATDVCGNSASQSQTITVNDQTPPIITACPSPITVACAGTNGTVVTFAVTATDTCGPAPTVTCNPPSGFNFPDGVTTVTCTATDACGNSSTPCVFTVTITDNVKPNLATADVTVECGPLATDPSNTGTPLLTDNCDPNPQFAVPPYVDSSYVEVDGDVFGWTRRTSGSGTATFVNGPGSPPLATGSLRLALGATAGTASGQNTNYSGTLISALTELRYSTYRTNHVGGEAVLLIISVDLDNNGTADDTLYFEPRYQTGINGTPNQGAVLDSTWQNWNALGGAWWSDSGTGGTPGPGVQPLTVYLAAHPSAKIADPTSGGVKVQAGGVTGNWTPFDGNVDRVIIGVNSLSTTYNFELTSGLDCVSTKIKQIILRTWTASDIVGNTNSYTQTIIVIDTTGPVVSCPAGTTVSCAGDVPASATDYASFVTAGGSAVDACGGPSTVTWISDVISGQTCDNRYTITRTYRATDVCGNSASCAQLITVDDETAPSITCPVAVTVSCPGNVPANDFAGGTATDNCPGLVNVAWISDVISGQTCDNRYTITRTYRATDVCGNSASCAQLITVDDETAPSITCPVAVTVSCSGNVPANDFAGGSATDNCPGLVNVAWISDVISGQTCDNRYTITRTYRATDVCGNSASCAQLITVDDETAPSITCPVAVTVSCSGNVPANDFAGGTATDNCPGLVNVAWISDVISGQTCDNRYTITRTYRATDVCGNSASCAQLITVDDETPPSITCPVAVTVSCPGNVPANDFAGGSATDNCPGLVNVTWISDVISGQTCDNRYTITRTYRATDVCGNSASCAQLITVDDETAPSITCPVAVTVSCSGNVPATDFAGGTATDNCPGLVNVTWISDVISGQTCDNRYTITRTYRATDVCGNSASCAQLITVDDETPPSITCPVAVTVSCSGNVPATDFAGGTATDNCPGLVNVTWISDVISGQTCDNRYTITRTYRATDVCGNSASCAQLITVDDETAPSITCPVAVTVSCSGNVPANDFAGGSATDNCPGLVNVAWISDVISGQTCDNRYTITRTYRATDVCGNSASCAQLITVDDETAPSITCPVAVTVSCSGNVPANDFAGGTATDNCPGLVNVAWISDVISGQTCDNRYTITRTYRATDVCGNSASCAQLITVDDETPPSITCPVAVTVSCPGNVPANDFAGGSATDNCPGLVNVTWISDVISGQTCDNRYTITRTYRATDVCGNSASCAQLITVDDETAPSITCPVAVTVSCSGNVPATDFAGGTATDNCPGLVNVTWISDVISGQTCDNRYTITRTYRATDVCGNSASCAQLITVDDETAPTVTAGTIAACYVDVASATNAAIAATTASDTCGSVTKTASVVGTCSATITVTASDACGNSASVVYNTRIDNTPPVVGAITATEQVGWLGIRNVFNCATNTVQGTVNISVVANDNCSLVDGHPSISLTNGVNTATATFVNESPTGTFNYTWIVGPATANGTWTATVAASDLCNVTTATFTLCVDSSLVTGQVQLEGFVGTGTSPLHSRIVTFVASTNNPTFGTNVLATWSLLLTNVSGDTFDYGLTGVPLNANHLSAKTAWNLRSSLPLVLVGGQASGVNFTGAKQLRGGDFTGDNIINFPDYSVLGNNFFTFNAVADITGDGQVNLDDYFIELANWFTTGDPQ